MPRIVSSNHGFYFSIAKQKLKEAEEIELAVNQDTSAFPSYFERDGQAHIPIITSVIFSALTAEAFINYYFIWNNTFKIWDNEWCKKREIKEEIKDKFGIDGVSETVAKWVRAPKIVVNRELRTDRHVPSVKKLQNLFTLRNKLVHYKAVEDNVEDIQEGLTDLAYELIEQGKSKIAQNSSFFRKVELSVARDSVSAVIEITQALKEVDPNVDSEWLNDLLYI